MFPVEGRVKLYFEESSFEENTMFEEIATLEGIAAMTFVTDDSDTM